MARVFLTGATGFVGRAVLPELLLRGHRVRALVRRASDEVEGAERVIGDVRTVQVEPCDVVVHLAAVVDPALQSDEREIDEVVHRAAVSLADRAAPARFVFTSSIAAVGFFDGVVTATTPCCPTTPYGRAKRAAEEALLARGAIVLRPPTIHGPGERYNFLAFARAVKRGVFRPIGTGANAFPLVSLANVVRAIADAVDGKVPPGLHPLADPARYSIVRVHRAIADALGVRAPRVHLPVPVARALAVGNEIAARFGAPIVLSRARIRTLTVDQTFDVGSLLRAGVQLTATLEADVRETIADQRRRGLL